MQVLSNNSKFMQYTGCHRIDAIISKVNKKDQFLFSDVERFQYSKCGKHFEGRFSFST